MCKEIFAAAAIAFTAFGQTGAPQQSMTFEVASVKPAQPPTPDGQGRIFMRGPSGGPGTKDPGRITYPYMTLKNILMTAYNVKNYQINGPSWLDSERFDVTATMPPETTKEQLQVMLQNLLIERFKMSIHREKKELPMYSLVVTKAGKLKESAATTPAPDADGPPPPP
ncbi:MAG TPA: TIGR03435 family protein, partial [Candidatus Acidoferrales bacterium]|nr:TIGR03435 family protein [Candidatus Acidoferrales bacterium]